MKMFCFPSEKGSTLKEGSKFFSLRDDPFLEGDWCVGNKHETIIIIVIALVKNARKSARCIQSLYVLMYIYSKLWLMLSVMFIHM